MLGSEHQQEPLLLYRELDAVLLPLTTRCHSRKEHHTFLAEETLWGCPVSPSTTSAQ